jgi:outer membrane lipoprotein-sorting protein
MKKGLVFFAALAFFSFATANAQEASKKKVKEKAAKVVKSTKTAKTDAAKVDGPGMVFENETIDYGTIAHNADGKREFVLTNNGNKPLIISNAQGSCGCTVPTYPKEPIAPGAKAVIGVKYATDRVGPFTKTVTLTTNLTDATKANKVLTIKGTVLPDAPAPSPVAEPKKE